MHLQAKLDDEDFEVVSGGRWSKTGMTFLGVSCIALLLPLAAVVKVRSSEEYLASADEARQLMTSAAKTSVKDDSGCKIVDRVLSASISQFHRVDLDDAVLAKPAQFQTPSRAGHRGAGLASRWFNQGQLSPRHASARAASRGHNVPEVQYRQRQQGLQRAVSERQVVQFKEPETDVTVKIVGVMHYNPSSIQLATDTIEELGEDGKLASVIIESCDVRWAKIQGPTDNPVAESFLRSEMETACDMALSYNRPVVLGDQRVNVTVSRLQEASQETFKDMLRPVAGWQRIARNITRTWRDGIAVAGDGYLSAFAFADTDFLMGTPIAVAKYISAFFSQLPLQMLGLVTVLILTEPTPTQEAALSWQETFGTIGLSALTLSGLMRILFKVILEQRNEVLAQSVLEQCRLYQTKNKPLSLRQRPKVRYVTESVNTFDFDAGKGEKTVVAVIGMAHCNGIMKILKDRQHQ